VAEILIERETESDRGWRFDVLIRNDDADEQRLRVRLSWADYDLWGRGSIPPVSVVRALVDLLSDRGALETLGSSFDASSARRLVRTLDADMPEQLAKP